MKPALIKQKVERLVRCYDSGDKAIDRYTVVYTGRYRKSDRYGLISWFHYVSMSGNPFHPQGFGQHGENPVQIDVNKWGFAPMVGRRNHLGVRIRFKDLPKDCRKLVMSDLVEIWSD